jgi:hypothetical protein
MTVCNTLAVRLILYGGVIWTITKRIKSIDISRDENF